MFTYISSGLRLFYPVVPKCYDMNANDRRSWEDVQAEFSNVPGTRGIDLRYEHYAPFFLRMGRNVRIDRGCCFYHPDRIVLDDDVRINVEALIYGSGGLFIGRHARIGPRFFIHSANHDVDDDGTAFFERSYNYRPTKIGDNVLISANVSIMPGAIIGDSSFIAAGSVVVAGDYEPKSRLFGLPASRKDKLPLAEVKETPEIAILVPEIGDRKSAFKHLLSALGLPQVKVLSACDPFPKSVHSVILDEAIDEFPHPSQTIRVWRLTDKKTHCAKTLTSFDAPSGSTIPLPEVISTLVVPDGQSRKDRWLSALEQALFWISVRLAKRPSPMTAEEANEWHATFAVIGEELQQAETLFKNLNELLENSWPKQNLGGRGDVILAAMHGASNNQGLTSQIANLAYSAKSSADLIASGVAASLLNDESVIQIVKGTLANPDWCVPGVAMPRSSRKSSGFCYSPLLLAWYFLQARRENPNFKIPRDLGAKQNLVTSLEWLQVENGKLMDENNQQISNSFIENWLLMHKAQCPTNFQVVLEDINYHQSTHSLELAWTEIFLFLQGQQSRPLIRLRPWPTPNEAAVSLRYDVDRPISVGTISSIVESQAKLANSPCGSWYFFDGKPDNEAQLEHLNRFSQEVGLHVQDPCSDPVADLGVTHHSAPTSLYWRGDKTNATLNDRGAKYCEFLNVQTGYPRPVWICDTSGTETIGTAWTTPIHFPLEGSTTDTDLAYFDQRLCAFRELMKAGGHCIIATHPDLNQSLMNELIVREKLEKVWFAPVGTVVERCRKTMQYGAIRCTTTAEGEIALISDTSLADVQVQILHFGTQKIKSLNLQLEAGYPRAIAGEIAL